MDLAAIGAWAGLATLLLVVIAGCFTRLNLGVLALVSACVIGALFGLPLTDIAGLFPAPLFLRLVAITSLFALGTVNGTLPKLAWVGVRFARFNRKLVPLLFFVLAVTLATGGAGNFAATAMLAPVAMRVAGELRLSAFPVAVMVVYGASGGAFSPVAPTGIVARDIMVQTGIGASPWPLFLNSLAAHTLVAALAYLLLGGWKRADPVTGSSHRPARVETTAWSQIERITIVVLALFLVAALLLPIDVGFAAAAGAVVVGIAGRAAFRRAVEQVPWRVILMVCGVTVLAGVTHRLGGMELLAHFLATSFTGAYFTGGSATVAGLISVYASSIGVVLPAFLPAVPDLVRAAGGGDPLMVAYSINVGAHLVDISPLSPLGAMCLAYCPAAQDPRRLFRRLMAMGLGMSVVGGALCQLLFGS
jgi:Na+/H+ antiporter NhaD/arsenite permease-like protein